MYYLFHFRACQVSDIFKTLLCSVLKEPYQWGVGQGIPEWGAFSCHVLLSIQKLLTCESQNHIRQVKLRKE